MSRAKALEDEFKFLSEYRRYAKKHKMAADPDDPEHKYDYRALYRDKGKIEPDEQGHLPSKYKRPGHKRTYVNGKRTFAFNGNE